MVSTPTSRTCTTDASFIKQNFCINFSEVRPFLLKIENFQKPCPNYENSKRNSESHGETGT